MNVEAETEQGEVDDWVHFFRLTGYDRRKAECKGRRYVKNRLRKVVGMIEFERRKTQRVL